MRGVFVRHTASQFKKQDMRDQYSPYTRSDSSCCPEINRERQRQEDTNGFSGQSVTTTDSWAVI